MNVRMGLVLSVVSAWTAGALALTVSQIADLREVETIALTSLSAGLVMVMLLAIAWIVRGE